MKESNPIKERLLKAVQEGKLEEVKELLQIDINEAWKTSALSKSVNEEKEEIVELLLQNGANPNGEQGRVHAWAASMGNMKILKLLQAYGANIGMSNDQTINWAASNNQVEMTKYLLELGDYINKKPETALMALSAIGETEQVRKLILAGTPIEYRDGVPLQKAAYHGHLSTVKLLVESGANLHAEENLALREAAQKGHFEIVEYLIESGADVLGCGNGALQTATYEEHTDVVVILLKNGANPFSEKTHPYKETKDCLEVAICGENKKLRKAIFEFITLENLNEMLKDEKNDDFFLKPFEKETRKRVVLQEIQRRHNLTIQKTKKDERTLEI